MTEKKTKKGLPAPESKHSGTPEIEKSAHLTGAIVASTVRFAVILGCAAALGYLLDLPGEHCKFIPHWMIEVGHWVDYLLYGCDIIAFAFDVTLHFVRHIRHAWTEFRNDSSKHDEE